MQKEVVPEANKKAIIRSIKSFNNKDELNIHLAGLMSAGRVERRRANKSEEEAKFHDCIMYYRIRANNQDQIQEIQVCKNAFISLHGITRSKVDVSVNEIKLGNVSRDL